MFRVAASIVMLLTIGTDGESHRTPATPGKNHRNLPPNWREQFAAAQDQAPPNIDRVTPHPGGWIVDDVGLDEVQIGFTEAVSIPAGAVSAWTLVGGTVSNLTTSFDGNTNTLTVGFASPIRDNRLTLIVDYAVTDVAGNQLDGEINNPLNPVLPSGDGFRGGQGVFRFNILQGDANRDGIVNAADAALIQPLLGICADEPGFNPLADLNVDGCVNVIDAGIYRLAEGRTLPATDGAPPFLTTILEPENNSLLRDLFTLRLVFNETMLPPRIDTRTCYVVDQNGNVIVPQFVALGGFGDIMVYTFNPPLPQCGTYRLGISNALADFSGELLSVPTTPSIISGFVGPPAPTLNAHTTSTKNSTVTITGTAAGANAVEVSGPMGVFTVPVTNPTLGNFTVDFTQYPLVDNRVNAIYFTALSRCDGIRSPPTRTAITRDNQPPTLFIDFPVDGASITTSGTDVAGRVGDLLSGYQGLSVTVNGITAAVNEGIGNNGTFFAANVPLNPNQSNVIQVTATDQLGNSVTKQITVTQAPVPPNTRRMVKFSGNGQSNPIHTLLPQPIVVQVFREDGTTPLPNKWVKFEVTRSNGRLSGAAGYTCMGDGTAILQCRTDATGKVNANWTLGDDAGEGNNRVRVTATEIAGTVEFCATAEAGPIKQINVGMGNNQIVEVGAPAPEPLIAWVNDACNGNCPVQVTFTVVEGGGKVTGNTSPLPCNASDPIVPPTFVTGQPVTVYTSRTGHAEVRFTAGPNPGNNRITASVAGLSTPATFIVYGVKCDPAKPTSFTGLVVDNGTQPIQGAECTLTIPCMAQPNGLWQSTVYSNLNGQFQFTGVPDECSGPAGLTVDGFPATHIGGYPGVDVPPQSYPSLHYEPVVIPHAENSLPRPVRLPKMDECNRAYYSRAVDTILTIRRRNPALTDPNDPNYCLPAIDGLRFIVKAGSMTIFGQPAPEGSLLMLNQVHHDDIPMPLPDGAAPPMTGTLWPPYAKFDPPIAVEFPNMVGLPPGAIAYFLSFDHDTSRFEIVASGHVTADGSLIVTDPGVGIPHGGWHGNCPPYSVTGDCDRCEGDPCCNDRCCGDPDPCCNDPDPCCNSDDPCCGIANRCCNSDDPCCGSPNPCCNSNDPCCGNPDRCCNSDDPCCASNDPCCNDPDPCCDIDCNDGNPCTTDYCENGACHNPCLPDCGGCEQDRVCFNCGCVSGNCSFNVIEEDGCSGGTVELESLGSCGPDCGPMIFSMEKSVEYLVVTLPGSIPCDGATHQRTVTVRIGEDAPPGPRQFRILGMTPLAECEDMVNVNIVECVDLSYDGVADEDETDPGGFLCVNDDDDDGNDTPDKDDSGLTINENDLKPLVLSLNPGWSQTGVVLLRCRAGCDKVKFYDNADRSNPFTLPVQWSVPHPDLPKTLYVEGVKRSTAPRDVTIEARFNGGGTECKDVVKLTVVQVDLDVDSDNDGTISDTDDPIENDPPGKFAGINDDDDDLDGTQDSAEAGPIMNEDDLVPIALHTDFTPPDPATAIWTLSWSPASRIRVWDAQNKGGNEIGSGVAVPWTAYNGVPASLYVEGVEPGAVAVTLRVRSPEFPNGCIDIIRLTVLRIEFFRDAAATQRLDDWPEDPANGFPRSPKYVFAKEDNIFARITTEPGFGSGYFSFVVSSDSDAVGVSIRLDEIAPGIHQNTQASGELLRLANATTSGAIDTILAIDEEILTFDLNLWPIKRPLGIARGVMVDRAEAAGGGINLFYGATTGDRSPLNQRLWGDAKWWKNGDFDAANTSPADLLTLRSLVKNAGDNQSSSLEADLLFVSTHGAQDGNLYNDAPSVILDPDAGGALGLGAGDWSSDVDWVVIAACSELHDGQSCHTPTSPTGRQAWQTSAFLGARPIHGILGAFCPLAGDLSGLWTDFWNRVVNQELSILPSYALAMEFGHPNGPQPYAAMWITNMNYNNDKLRTMQRDLTQALVGTFAYITLASLGNPICGRAADPAQQWPNGVAARGEISNVADLSRPLPALAMLIPVRPDLDPGFEGMPRHRGDGSLEIASEKFYTDGGGVPALPQNDVERMAKSWVENKLGRFAGTLEVREVAPVNYEESDRQGLTKKKLIVGYVVDFKQTLHGVPILFSTVRLRIIGQEIAGCLVRVFDTAQEQPQRLEPNQFLSAQAAFSRSLEATRRGIERADGNLHVLSAVPTYWIGGGGSDAVTIGKSYEAKLVYRFLVADKECEGAPCIRSLWWVIVNAMDGTVEQITGY